MIGQPPNQGRVDQKKRLVEDERVKLGREIVPVKPSLVGAKSGFHQEIDTNSMTNCIYNAHGQAVGLRRKRYIYSKEAYRG